MLWRATRPSEKPKRDKQKRCFPKAKRLTCLPGLALSCHAEPLLKSRNHRSSLRLSSTSCKRDLKWLRWRPTPCTSTSWPASWFNYTQKPASMKSCKFSRMPLPNASAKWFWTTQLMRLSTISKTKLRANYQIWRRRFLNCTKTKLCATNAGKIQPFLKLKSTTIWWTKMRNHAKTASRMRTSELELSICIWRIDKLLFLNF